MSNERLENNANGHSIWVKAYTPQGFQVGITLTFESWDQIPPADLLEAMLLNTGYSVNVAGLEPGADKEAIMSVMRLEAPKDGTPKIYFYPEWKGGGNYGKRYFGFLYLNTAEDIAQFEAQSGLKLDELPIFEGEKAPDRTHGNPPHKKEIAVKRSFEMVKVPTGETYETGMQKYEYRYAKPLPIGKPEPRQQDQPPANVKDFPGKPPRADNPPTKPAGKTGNPKTDLAHKWATDTNLAVLKQRILESLGQTLTDEDIANYAAVSDFKAYAEWNEQYEYPAHAREAVEAAYRSRDQTEF